MACLQHAKSLVTAQALDALVVDAEALLRQQDRRHAAIAIAGVVPGPARAAGPGGAPLRRPGTGGGPALGGTGLADGPARPTLGEPESLHEHHLHRPAAACRAQKFPSATSFKAGDVEGLVGHDALEPGVLALELLQALRVVGLHAAVLVPPAVIGLLGDLEVPSNRRDVGPFGEQPVGLAELADDLLGCVPSMLHL